MAAAPEEGYAWHTAGGRVELRASTDPGAAYGIERLAWLTRSLLRALPELDGVTPCVGDIIPSYDFRALDIVHSKDAEPDPRMEERYRAFSEECTKWWPMNSAS